MSRAQGVPRRRPGLLLRLAVLLGAPPAVLTTEPATASAPLWGPIMRRASLLFAPIAVAVTAGYWLTYVVAFDTAFRSAFSPQAQTAVDAAARLDAGADPMSVLPAYRIDMSRSLYPYLAVYDRAGVPLASTVELDGRQPVLPSAVFDYARTGVERHDATWYAVYAGPAPWIYWTPRPGLTSAVVVQPWSGGFVIVGRSAEGPAGELAVAWALTLAATAAACLLMGVIHPMHAPPASGGGGGGEGPERDPQPPTRPRERRHRGLRPLVRRRQPARPRSHR